MVLGQVASKGVPGAVLAQYVSRLELNASICSERATPSFTAATPPAAVQSAEGGALFAPKFAPEIVSWKTLGSAHDHHAEEAAVNGHCT